MKVYIVSYIGMEGGEIEAFTSKTKAEKRQRELNRERELDKKMWKDAEENNLMAYEVKEKWGRDTSGIEQLFPLSDVEFEINRKGIIQAIEYGAATVYK